MLLSKSIRTAAWWVTVIYASLLAGQALAADGSFWRTDFAKAQAEAEERQIPLLLHFYATWCGPCSQMDRHVFKDSEVQQTLGDRFVAVKIDSDQRPDLGKRFGIELLPSDVVINPINGRVLLEKQGAMSAKEYLAMTSRADAKFQQLLAVNQTKRQADDAASAIKADFNRGGQDLVKLDPLTVELGEPRPLIGLDGFSPVTLTKTRKWIRGSADFAWDYQGVIYQMTSRDELLEFRRDPAAFAPRLLGCDPVTLFETDRAVPGRTLFGAFYDDELYLFTSAENRKRFKASPARFMKTQHVLKLNQIDRTAMLEGSHLK